MPSRQISSPTPRSGAESQTLTRLFQARSEWDRLYQLSNLLKEAQIDLPDFFDSNIGATICREPNSEKLAWRLAREIFRRNNGKIPSSLQPYLDRPDFEQQERAEEADSFRKELLEWLSSGQDDTPAHPRRELRIVWKVESGFDPLEAFPRYVSRVGHVQMAGVPDRGEPDREGVPAAALMAMMAAAGLTHQRRLG